MPSFFFDTTWPSLLRSLKSMQATRRLLDSARCPTALWGIIASLPSLSMDQLIESVDCLIRDCLTTRQDSCQRGKASRWTQPIGSRTRRSKRLECGCISTSSSRLNTSTSSSAMNASGNGVVFPSNAASISSTTLTSTWRQELKYNDSAVTGLS